MAFVRLLVWACGGLLAACAGYNIVLMMASLPSLLRRRRRPELPPRTRFLVVIPAHDEAALIGETVRSVLASDYPSSLREVVVIADNCADDTATRARGAGAICLERVDRNRRGKPWALHWAFRPLDLSVHDGIALIDADTVVDARFLSVMDGRLQRGERAIQGYYGVLNPDETWLTRLAGLPAALNNYFLYPGKQALGLSCSLAGNGMCFDGAIIRRLGWNAFTLSEDWEYYLILSLHDVVVTSAADAIIYGQVARSLELGQAQRIRWMKGRTQALAIHWRALARKGLRERTLVPLDAMFDIARPTHAILLVWSLGYLALTLALWRGGVIPAAPVAVASLILIAQIVYFLAGLAIGRPPLHTWPRWPRSCIWPGSRSSIRALFSLHERTWVKTTRN